MAGISTLIKHWSDHSSESIGKLTGLTVTGIWVSESRITFGTDAGELTWEAEGDCCSHSYLYSVEGVARLLAGTPIVAVHTVELQEGDVGYHDPDCGYAYPGPSACGTRHDVLQVYGYSFTTVDPQWGEVTSVLSFRNDSNGYYGGWLAFRTDGRSDDQRQITADWVTSDLGED